MLIHHLYDCPLLEAQRLTTVDSWGCFGILSKDAGYPHPRYEYYIL